MLPRIAIVDDCASHADYVCALLLRCGYDAVIAPCGRHAPEAMLRLHAERPIGLLVTDLFMPEFDGIEMLRLARTSLPGVAVIAVSGSGSPLLHSLPLLGVDAVLTKPIETVAFLAAVATALAPRAS